jgi:light-regulated signal transduction histidine kinase (bacteriophytochrome)
MQGFVKEISFEMVKKDKTRLPILINTKQIRDENGKVQINYSTVFDISQRKSYEKELLKAKKTVEQQNELIQETNEKFQASEEELKSTIEEIERLNENLNKQKIALTSSNKELEQFAYVASHDLQEPLRMVTSFLTQLENKYAAVIDDKGKQYIGFAVDGAKRMRQIILDLLEYSKIGRTEEVKDYLDLNTLIDGIKILLRETIEENKAVLIIDHLPKIYSYWSPMRQVFQNLITNALKYSKKEIPTEIHITVKDLKDYWQFSVTDNGIGIEKEYHEKIFIIFQRLHTKEEYSGTGIGLAIVKKIIEIQDGKIWVESEKGKGSTFYFTIKK